MANTPRRVGLVLGAGGAVGHAFHAGVLSALAERTGFDPREAELVVGTSAGSIVGALLRAGIGVDDIVEGTIGRGMPTGLRERFAAARQSANARAAQMPRNRGLRLGLSSPGVLAELARRPWRLRPGAVAAALLPAGRVPTSVITDWLELVLDGWPERALWVCAVNRSNGRRVVFGRDPEPTASPAIAVAASCAVPGLFTPVVVGDSDYIDGGVHSPTNADVVAGLGLDVVVVSSPMSAARPLRPGLDLPGRRLARLTLAGEVAAIRRGGTRTLVFQPTAEDRRVMGLNAMDRSRREAVIRQAHRSAGQRLERADAAEAVAALAAVAAG